MNFDIVDIVTLIIAVAGAVLAWRKAPSERRSLDADAAEKYQQIAANAADREEELKKRLLKLEAKVAEMEKQVKEANDRAIRFENYAKRLSYQVKALGHIPVPLDEDSGKDGSKTQ